MITQTPDTVECALEILGATNDGDDLSPIDLALLEAAVNSQLTDSGQSAFRILLKRVRHGYQPQWFHDVEQLTIDHQGFVSWKGQIVERYTGDPYSPKKGREARELARRCLHLESLGVDVNMTNAIWQWEKFERQP